MLKKNYFSSSERSDQVDEAGDEHSDGDENLPPEAAGEQPRGNLQQDVTPEERRQDCVLNAPLPFKYLQQIFNKNNFEVLLEFIM